VAINSTEYRAKIKEATGWDVNMLPKEEEGRTGAYGVASSFDTVRGIMMDLGGGSTQITWLMAENGDIKMSPTGSVSMPYGAAALSRQLDEATKMRGNALAELREEISSKLKDAVQAINIPEELLRDAKSPNGLNLYLSGGGFRGWGFVLMSQHEVRPYPIPIINGFKTSTTQFSNIQLVTTAAEEDDNIFRVSERRASQVPAVALLVSCLCEVLPAVRMVSFAQGGVREGALFPKLTSEMKAQHPIDTATRKFATTSALGLMNILVSSFPPRPPSQPSTVHIHRHLVRAFAQSMYIHNTSNKDIQAASGLRSTTTGVLGPIHGADHQGRAMLGIMLCERWGGVGALSPGDADFYQRLVALLSPEDSWWVVYLGRVGSIVGEVYPAGVVDEKQPLVSVSVNIVSSTNGDAKQKINLLFSCDPGILTSEGFLKCVKRLEKLGKKKNWPRGSAGCKIDVTTKVKS
jgi:retrograde regulation protein 2